MNEPADPTRELLLEHVAWMRALARSLVSDAHAAEDLAQDVSVAALESGPADSSRWKSWIRSAMAHRASDRSRARRNALARECERARPEALPDTGELLERVETQRRVAAHLLALDEPYRTALLLRFYEGLPPREIAARTGTRLSTVKSRIYRGLEILRERLDRENRGDRCAWLTALAPFCHESVSSPWPLLIGMNVKSLVAVLLVVAAGAWWIGRDTIEGADPGAPISTVASPESAPTGGSSQESAVVAEPDSSADRRAGPVRTEVASGPATAAVDIAEVRVRVLDASARVLGGHALRIAGSDSSTQSDAHGYARFALDAERARIESADADWVTVRPAEWRRGSTLALTVVVAPAVDVSGDVVGEWGEPLRGARVEFVPPADFARRFLDPLDATSVARFETAADASGAFVLERVPAIDGAVLRATHESRGSAVIDSPRADTSNLRFVLSEVARELGRALDGRVVRRDGSPAGDARVALGLALSRTDARGAFTIDLGRANGATRLVAVEAGSLPGAYERGEHPWPTLVEIVLGEPCLSIEGRVVDADGKPKSGAQVWVDDPTPFGVLGMRPLRLEFLASGAPLPRDAVSTLADSPEDDGAREFSSARPAREPDALLAWVVTDSEGRFELRGLQERAYVLAVLDPLLHYGTISDPIDAGARGVVVELPPDEHAVIARLRGRVVTRLGDPVAGVSILPFVAPVSSVERVFGGSVDVSRFFEGESVRTATDGSFELRDVPRAHISFQLSGDSIGYAYASVEEVVDPADHRFVVAARVRVEIELADPSYADAARAADVEGRAVRFVDARADGYSNQEELRLADGRSGSVLLSTDAATISLWKAGQLVETIPVRLVGGETTRILR